MTSSLRGRDQLDTLLSRRYLVTSLPAKKQKLHKVMDKCNKNFFFSPFELLAAKSIIHKLKDFFSQLYRNVIEFLLIRACSSYAQTASNMALN